MGYEAAVNKAWEDLKNLSDKDNLSLNLLNDSYEIDLKDRKISSFAFRARAKDFLSILILHYLIGNLKNKYTPGGEWISFKDIEGGGFYYPAFYEGAIKPVIKKYGSDPQKLPGILNSYRGRLLKEGDVCIELETFDNVFVRVILWKGDDEFGPDATILFDRNLANIFSTEDIAVFLRFIAHKL